jgi:putative flippase GtrA
MAHYAVLVALVEGVGFSAATAAGFGAAVGAALNYLLNYKFTFRSQARHVVTAPRFALIAAVGLGASSAVVFLAVKLGVHYLIGQAVATVLVLLFGFLANQFWTFSEATSDHA